MLGVFPTFLGVNNVPNINKNGTAKRQKSEKKFRGPRGSEGGGSTLANSPEIISVYVFFFSPSTMLGANLSVRFFFGGA